MINYACNGYKSKKAKPEKGGYYFWHGGFVGLGNGSLFINSQVMNRKLVLLRRKLGTISIRRWLFWSVSILLGLVVVGSLGMVILFAVYSKDLPTPTKVIRHDGFATRIYDRNGQLLYDVYKDVKRTPVTWDQVPTYLRQATVAVEDKEFYKHQGYDPLAPFRIIKNVFYFHKLTGGSTLTQQLVKNVLLTSDRSVTRKIKEFILAVQLEKTYTKDQILLMYLNEAPYGGTAWGVEAASEQYFGKAVSELNLTESAILAGMPQSPNAYSPYSKTPTAYVARTEHVLTRMKEDGYINDEQLKSTVIEAKNYTFHGNTTSITAPHFVFWIKDQLAKTYGDDVVEGGGLKVTTTLDLELQKKAEDMVATEIDKSEKMGISNGAAVVIDPTNGQVLAMVGSRGYNSDKTDGQFNIVTQGLRQPGSAIKPVTYLTAFKQGMTPATMIMDTPVTFAGSGGQKDYSPQNYNGKFNGPMSIREALGNSINTIAVKTLAKVGIKAMMQQAFDMGFTTLEPTTDNLKNYGLSVTLGGASVYMIDLATAYSSFANGGTKVETTGILKVEDQSGRVLQEYSAMTGKAVMTPQQAFLISNILADNSARQLTFGANNSLVVSGYQVAVKTGTTNDKRDNWAIGWTPNILVAAWVGNNDNSPMLKVASGVSGATPIWRDIMLQVVKSRPKQDFPIPGKIVQAEVDKVSGYPSHDGFAIKTDYFIDGTQPKVDDPIHLKLKVCKDQAGLATPDDVANGNYNEKEYFKFSESDPVSADGVNRWQQGIDQWISQQTDKDLYNPPTGYCHSGGLVNVGIDSPSDHSTVSSTFDIKIKTTSEAKITEVKIWIDGNEYKTLNDKPFEVLGVHLADGVHKIKAKATDKDGNSQDREATFGVNVPWDYAGTPTPTSIPSLTPTASATPTITVMVTP